MRTPCSHLLTVLEFCILPPKKRPNGYRTAVPPLGGRAQRTKWNYPPNGQIQVFKQHTCIVWIISTLFTMSKCADLSVGSSNTLTYPLQDFGKCAPGGRISTEKSEITLSNGQIHVHKQRKCIVWVISTPPMVSKRAHLSVRSSN